MLAELMASYWPLAWYVYYRQQFKLSGMCHVHVVTDNQASVQQCDRYRETGSPKACAPFWAMIRQLEESHSLRVQLHWVRRATLGSAILADIVAGNARVAMKELTIPGAEQALSTYAYQATIEPCTELERLRRP